MKQRTDAYVFTAYTNNPDDMQRIETLRKMVRAANKHRDKKMRVSVKGRLGKNNPNRVMYRHIRRDGTFGPILTHSIKPKHAERVDVYIHDRSSYKY